MARSIPDSTGMMRRFVGDLLSEHWPEALSTPRLTELVRTRVEGRRVPDPKAIGLALSMLERDDLILRIETERGLRWKMNRSAFHQPPGPPLELVQAGLIKDLEALPNVLASVEGGAGWATDAWAWVPRDKLEDVRKKVARAMAEFSNACHDSLNTQQLLDSEGTTYQVLLVQRTGPAIPLRS